MSAAIHNLLLYIDIFLLERAFDWVKLCMMCKMINVFFVFVFFFCCTLFSARYNVVNVMLFEYTSGLKKKKKSIGFRALFNF